MSDYEKHPVEIIREKLWVIYDPWLAQDVAHVFNKEAAKLFKEAWENRSK